MRQILYVLIASDNSYWAGSSGSSEWWATYFTEAKVYTNRELAEKELKRLNIRAKIYKVLIDPQPIES